MTLPIPIYIISIVLIFILSGLKNIQPYQIHIVFTLGKYTKILTPGLRFIWPIFQSHYTVDIRKDIKEISMDLDTYNVPFEIKTNILDEIKKYTKQENIKHN